MNLAFLIAAHAYPPLLGRLVRRLQAPGASVHLHIDSRVDVAPFREAVAGCPAVHWARRVASGWGTFGQVEASLSLVRSALAQQPRPDMLLLLSGQDYPARPVEEMAAYFAQRPGVNFIECARLPWEKWSGDGGLDRLRRYHFTVGRDRMTYPSESLPGSRKLKLLYALCRLALPRSRPLPENIVLYGGANWWNLTPAAAEAVLAYDRAHPALRRACQHSLSSDEIFFQTALMGSGNWAIENDSRRWLFWDTERNELPGYVRVEHFDEIRASGVFFARKVHPERSLALLDRIDRQVFQVETSGQTEGLK